MKNEISYYWEIVKMNFQGAEGKVGSWVLELGNNSIEYGAMNIAVDIPLEKGETFSYHDDGNGIERGIFCRLTGLIKGKDRLCTFNRWNEGLKKILNLLSELYIETRTADGYFDGGLFRWKKDGAFIDTYDPNTVTDLEDDYELVRSKRNIMKYKRGTSFVPMFMFHPEKEQITGDKFEYWFKTYYHLLMTGIGYRKVNFYVKDKLLQHELTIPQMESIDFTTNFYKLGKKEREKIKIPVIIFRSDKPLPEQYRGVYIVVNGIRVEEIKINIPSEIEECMLIYVCADFFARKDITEDGQGLINRDKTQIISSETKKEFVREVKAYIRHFLGEEKKEILKSKSLNKLNKKLGDLLNTKKWKDLLKLPTEKTPPKEPECPECHTKNFDTWKEDERYNICENGHKWLKQKWARKCPQCGASDYKVEFDEENQRDKFTCNACGHIWYKEKRPRIPKQKLSVAQKDDLPLLEEVRYDKKENLIIINIGVPTYCEPTTQLGIEHLYKCAAKALSDMVADIHDWEKGNTKPMRLYYEAYMDLKEFSSDEKEKFLKRQKVLVTENE